jgi:predicted ATPase/DNA-binding winged helix-turn-helix (wHTH) protein
MNTGYRFGNAELRPDQRVLLVGGQESRIGARAFDLLVALVEHRDRVVAKNELLDSVWSGMVVEENNLQVHISSLRKVLGPQAIATVPGRGYRFTASLDDDSSGRPDLFLATGGAQGTGQTFTVSRLTNLPAELPALYGRDADLAALRAIVHSHRLVSVLGPGGIGKTSLAQALAHELRGSFSGGAWRVDLSSVASGSLVAPTAASVLGLVLRADEPVAALARSLAAKQMLVVLDNCEHVAAEVAELAAALHASAPGVGMIVTSQEPLKIAQEHVFRLGALELPADGSHFSARDAGAVALFEARAVAADPAFSLSAQNIAAAVDICRRLDGIPLAIELAAARVPLLGLDGLRARLDERFRVLTGGSRLALPRHQTLRAALAWSHTLLAPQEQAVFRRLGAFAGSFGLEGAQRVASDGAIDPWAVLDLLGALVDKSLVVAEPGEQPRYRLLETTRAFALEKLGDAGETDTTMRRHALAILAAAEELRQLEYEMARQRRLDRCLLDLDNARAALDWCAGRADEAQLHVALAGAIAWMWVEAGLRGEGQRRTRAALARIDAKTPVAARARLLASWSRLAFPEAGPRELEADAHAVALYRALDDRQRLFDALCRQVLTFTMAQDHVHAQRALSEAELLFEPGWPPGLRAQLLTARYWLFQSQSRFEDAAAVCAELHRCAVVMDDERLAFVTLINHEQALAALGRLEESVARGRELLEMMRRSPSIATCNEGYVYGNLSMSLAELGQVDEALDMARRAFAFREQSGGLLCVLDPLARLTFMRGRIHDAARILGRTDFRYATSHESRQAVEIGVRERLVRGLSQALAADELDRLMREGAALDDEAAARLALAQ